MTPLIGAILPSIVGLIDKIIPDKEAAAKAKLEVLKLEQEGAFKSLDADLQVMLAQTEVNKVEAASADAFRGGWRPAVGWVCVAGMGYTYILAPLLSWYATANGLAVPPTIDTFDLMIMLGGMLGFGGMRSFERIRGKA